MIIPKNVLKSSKTIGKYEQPIIDILGQYFSHQGYEVIPHARFNVAWGSILSDLDLLIVMDRKLLTLVEVKSKRDSISKARKQIERVQDYVDYAYVATEMQMLRSPTQKMDLPSFAGILGVDVERCQVDLIKKAEWIRKAPAIASVAWLEKKCLTRITQQALPEGYRRGLNRKWRLAEHVKNTVDADPLREIIKEIVVCGRNCEGDCPITKHKIESTCHTTESIS